MGIRDRSESRGGYAVRVLAVHTSEGIDKPVVDDAAALRDAAWWTGSSHAIADNDPGSLLTPAEGCVPYERASWTLRSGNRWSENIELVAQAGWTRAQWLQRPVLLDRCARWLADRSKARGIPLIKLTPQQYRAGASGVIGHNDHTVGYSDGTHWDPGPGFPWDVVLDLARAYAAGASPAATPEPIPLGDDDMRVLIDNRGTIYLDTGYEVQPTGSLPLAGLWQRRYGKAIECTEGEIGMIRADNEGRRARLLTLLAKSAGGDVDEAQIVAGLIPAIAEAVAGKTGATREEIAELLAGITLRAS